MTQRTVLVVDDEENVRLTLAASLELLDYEVVEAEDGQDAVEKVQQQAFDVVVMDVRMPRLNGVEAYRQIRKLRPTLPVLLVTGFEREQLLDEAAQEGIYTILFKPLDPERLTQIIERAHSRPFILVVEDSKEIARTMAKGLSATGLKTEISYDATQALKRIAEGQIDTCILDLNLPDMNGESVLKYIRSRNPDINVVVCSGVEDQKRIQSVLGAGAHTFLGKPVEIPKLVATIADARSTTGQD